MLNESHIKANLIIKYFKKNIYQRSLYMKKRTNPEFEMVIKNSRTNDDSGEGERSVVYNQQRYFTIFIFIL